VTRNWANIISLQTLQAISPFHGKTKTIAVMKKLLPGFLFLLMPLLWINNITLAQNPDQYEILKKGFAKPSGTALPKVYWWWLNGNMDTIRMKDELAALKKAGIGGVDIFEIGFRPDGVMPAGPAFMGDSSLKVIDAAIREANRLGLEVGLNLSSSWNAGGSWTKPEHAAKSLYSSSVKVKGGDRQINLPFPAVPRIDSKGKPILISFAADGKPVYRKEIAVLAIPIDGSKKFLDTSSILDLSNLFDEKKDLLNWTAPAGEWEIFRYICSNTGEQLKLPSPSSAGPIIDHFDSVATEDHFMYFVNKLRPVLGDLEKSGLKNFYLASFEATGTIWTPSLAAEFRKINGYDVFKFLPYLFNKNAFEPGIASKFKQDYDLTISELMINNHYRKGREVANRYGLQLISESGGPGPPLHNVPVESIKALGALDVPRGEFWINHSRMDSMPDNIDLLMLVKEIAAASRTYGHKITELESFTSFQNWQEGPGDMKPIGDRAFCEGMNRVVVHGFTHNPRGIGYPGIVYAAGTHYNDKTTWWGKIRPFNEYLSRVSYILQEASFVADVVYYYGDQVPNFATPKNTRFAVGSGYDYEIINTEVLLRDLKVKDGMLQLPNGARFKILALASIRPGSVAVWKKVQELVSQGAIITTNDKQLQPIKNADISFTASNVFDKGQSNTLYTTSPLRILTTSGIVPDFDYPEKKSEQLHYMSDSAPVLDYIHYKKDDLDFYFVRNTTDKWISRSCSFRQNGKSPEIWDPVTGQVIKVPVYDQEAKQISTPLTFPPYGSYFIVFAKPPKGVHYSRVTAENGNVPGLLYTSKGIIFSEPGMYELKSISSSNKIKVGKKSINITGSWKLTFPKNWGAPPSAEFPELKSWTESKDSGIKYFSGTATYLKSFEFKKDVSSSNKQSIFLDLGTISKVGEVWLNDQPLGISWTKPHRYDITDLIKSGANTLRIEVVNTWSNRIIGDITSEKKYTYTNLNVRGSRELLWTQTPLVPSGLLGPVQIEIMETVPATGQ
jgi:hypothetical protein